MAVQAALSIVRLWTKRWSILNLKILVCCNRHTTICFQILQSSLRLSRWSRC